MQTQEEHKLTAQDHKGVAQQICFTFHINCSLFVFFFSSSVLPFHRKHLYSQGENRNKYSYGIFSVECTIVSACVCDLMCYSEMMVLLAETHQLTFIVGLLSVF